MDIPILAPVIQREIIYRLLVGEQGERLRQISLVSGVVLLFSGLVLLALGEHKTTKMYLADRENITVKLPNF